MKFMTGTALHNLDAKNRIRIPAKFREVFDREKEDLHFVFFSKGAISIMTDSVLARRFGAYMDADATNEKLLRAKRFFMSRVEDIEDDNQGRITLSKRVRDYIGADKDHTELITVGMGDYVELWLLSRYNEDQEGMDVSLASGIASETKSPKEQ